MCSKYLSVWEQVENIFINIYTKIYEFLQVNPVTPSQLEKERAEFLKYLFCCIYSYRLVQSLYTY